MAAKKPAKKPAKKAAKKAAKKPAKKAAKKPAKKAAKKKPAKKAAKKKAAKKPAKKAAQKKAAKRPAKKKAIKAKPIAKPVAAAKSSTVAVSGVRPALYKMLTVGLDPFHILKARAGEGVGDLRIKDAFEIPFDGRGIHVGAVMIFDAFAQFECIAFQILGDVPFFSDARHDIHLAVEIEQALRGAGRRIGHIEHEMAMGIESGGIDGRPEPQRTATLWRAAGSGRRSG